MSDLPQVEAVVEPPAVEPEEVEEVVETPEAKVFDEKTVKDLRDENAARRVKQRETETRLSELQAKLDEFEQAQLSEKEQLELKYTKAQDELSKLKLQTRDTLLEAEVAKKAKEFELADVDVAVRLLNRDDVEYDDNGRPTNVDDVLKDTLAKYPILKAAPAATKPAAVNPGSTNPGKSLKNSDLSHASIKAMTHEQRVARMPEIQQWMSSNYGRN